MSGGYLGKISGIFGEVKPTIAKVDKKVVRVEKGGVHRNKQENKSKKKHGSLQAARIGKVRFVVPHAVFITLLH